MLLKLLFSMAAFCAGLIISMGVFSVLIAVSLIPRFAGRTNTADHILLYETFIVTGTILGGILTVFMDQLSFLPSGSYPLGYLNRFLPGIYGFFTGIFVGCLSIAIAEMLDAIPIFARRIGLPKGIGPAILSFACGKLAGSILYYYGKVFVSVF